MAVVKRFALDGVTYDIEPTNIDAVPTEGSNNTVSSSGVKSYVDSNYVPLSATQAPVTGLTDILTPVNLLPNSDFSRDGGYAATQTFETLAAASHVNIANGWEIYPLHTSLSNFTITINNGTLRLQGIQSTSDGETANGGCIILRNLNFSYPVNLPFTMGVTITKNDQVFNRVSEFSLGTNEIVYKNPYSDSNNKFISCCITSSNNTYGYILALEAGTNLSFDYTLSNFICYEGHFKNPPAYRSIDTNLTRSFLPRMLFNWYSSTYLTNITNVGWHRIYKIENIGTVDSPRVTFYGKIKLMKRYSNGLYESYIIKFALYLTKNEESNAGYYLEPVVYRSFSSRSKRFTKFALVKTNTGEFYLSGYMSVNYSDNFSVDILDFSTNDYSYQRGFSYDMAASRLKSILYDNRRVLNAYIFSDTILGAEVNTIEGTTNFTMPV